MHNKWISIECAYNICIRIFMHNSNHSAEKKQKIKFIVELIEEKQVLKMVYLSVSQK